MKVLILSVFCLVLIGGLTAASVSLHSVQDQDDISRRDMMRTKLLLSQNIVEGLTLSNFDQVKKSGNEIIELTKAEAWLTPKAPDYQDYSNQFRKSVELLIANAEEKNIDGSAMRFYDMTTNCIDCHAYLNKNQF